eukprot:scaffold1903_cov396-Prasinococcus_capsulatus_cf.AAC.12
MSQYQPSRLKTGDISWPTPRDVGLPAQLLGILSGDILALGAGSLKTMMRVLQVFYLFEEARSMEPIFSSASFALVTRRRPFSCLGQLQLLTPKVGLHASSFCQQAILRVPASAVQC